MEIMKVEQRKDAFMPLFLLADPSKDMVGKYLDQGDLFVLYADGVAACVAVVVEYGPDACELKNLATAEPLQRRGYAGQMLQFLFFYLRAAISNDVCRHFDADAPILPTIWICPFP